MDRISRLIDKASLFAKNAHFDQKRKYSGEPYWNHLQEVAITLLQYGATPAVIAAGYLRDTLEEQRKLRGAPLYPYLFYARNAAYFRAAKAMWAALQQETNRVPVTLRALLNRRVASWNGCEF